MKNRILSMILTIAVLIGMIPAVALTAFANTDAFDGEGVTLTMYTVTVDSAITHGTVTSSVASASAGTTVTLTATPDDGYSLATDTLTVSDGTSEIEITAGGNNTFTFTMPATNVTVTARFGIPIGEVYYVNDDENSVTTFFGIGTLSSASSLANILQSNVVIEEGITAIDNNAFRGLSSLATLTVKGDLTAIGRNAFQGCSSLEAIYYYGTTSPSSVGNDLSGVKLYSANGVSVFGLQPENAYTVSINATENGTVTVPQTMAAAGDTVKLTVKAAEGYELDTLTVSDGTGSIPTTKGHAILYTFPMPAANVTVTATFKVIAYATKTELENAVKKLQEQIDALEAELDANGGTTGANLQSQIDILAAALVTVNQTLNGLDTTYVTHDELTETLKSIQEAIATLDNYATDAELAQAIATAEQKVQELYDQAIKDVKAELKKAVDTLQDAIDTKADAEETKQALLDLTDAIAKAQAAAEQFATDADTALKSDLEGQIQKAKDEITDAYKQAIADAEDALKVIIEAGDKANADELAKAIVDLKDLIRDAQAAAEQFATDADAALKSDLEGQIQDAKDALNDAIEQVQKNLEKAEKELDKAIKDGDKALDDKIVQLSKALADVIAAYKLADATVFGDLSNTIEEAENTLSTAIGELQKDLDDAKAELNEAIAKGDDELDAKITALNEALAAAKAALEAADDSNKSELTAEIEQAEKALGAAIDALSDELESAKSELAKADADNKAALEAKDSELEAKDDQLNTLVTVAIVIAVVGVCGNVALVGWILVDKRKKII